MPLDPEAGIKVLLNSKSIFLIQIHQIKIDLIYFFINVLWIVLLHNLAIFFIK